MKRVTVTSKAAIVMWFTRSLLYYLSLSTVHCPLFTVHCPLFTVHCPLYCTLSTVHCRPNFYWSETKCQDNQRNSYSFKFIIIEIWSSNIQLAFKWIHNYGEKCKNIKVLRQSTAHAHSQRRIEPRAARRQRSGRSPHHKPYIFWKLLVQGYQNWYYQVSHTQIHKYKYTNTQIQHWSKLQIDVTFAIFLKR